MPPVRDPIRGNKTRIRTLFASRKNGRMVGCESTLERDHLYHLEADPNVIRFSEQPFHVEYTFEGKICSYTPDFLVDYAEPARQEIHEVKSERELKRGDTQARLDAVRQRLEPSGSIFRIVTDREIRSQPRLNNLAVILRYQIWPVDQCADVAVLPIGAPAQSIKSLTGANPWQTVLPLIASGIIGVDLDLPLSAESLVWKIR